MKIIFLAKAKADLRWFKRYYMSVFPQGRENADQHYFVLLKILRSSPMIGELAQDAPNARQHPIKNTPFTVLYRVRPDCIEIMRVLDQRSGFSNERKL